MNIDSLMRDLRVLWRADSIIAELRIRVLATKTGMHVFAALTGVSGLLMIGFAGYLFLSQLWGPIAAALTVGLVNVFVGVLVASLAQRVKPGREPELAMELQKSAHEARAADARGIEQSFRHPFDAMLPSVVMPLVTTLLRGVGGRGKGGNEKS